MLRLILLLAAIATLAALAFGDDAPPAPSEAPKPPAYAASPVKVTLADGSRGLRVKRLVKAPIADVWRAWSTSEGLGGALDKSVTIEPRIGGKFEILWKADAPEGERGSEGCVVQAWIPNRMLAFTWNAPPQFGAARAERSLVVVELDEVAPSIVQIRLTHLGFGTGAEWDGVYDYFAEAWPYVVDKVAGSLGGALTKPSERQLGWVYLITDIYRDKDEFIKSMTDDEKRIMGEHSTYLSEKTRDGQVIHAGPCTDMIGPGIVIFYADSEEAAREFMANDPAVKHGIFIAELHPLALSLVRERDRAKP